MGCRLGFQWRAPVVARRPSPVALRPPPVAPSPAPRRHLLSETAAGGGDPTAGVCVGHPGRGEAEAGRRRGSKSERPANSACSPCSLVTNPRAKRSGRTSLQNTRPDLIAPPASPANRCPTRRSTTGSPIWCDKRITLQQWYPISPVAEARSWTLILLVPCEKP